MWSATDIFLVVASICTVVLTLIFAAVALALLAAIGEARSFVQRLGNELQRLQRTRERIVRRGRFVNRFATIFVQRVLARMRSRI